MNEKYRQVIGNAISELNTYKYNKPGYNATLSILESCINNNEKIDLKYKENELLMNTLEEIPEYFEIDFWDNNTKNDLYIKNKIQITDHHTFKHQRYLYVSEVYLQTASEEELKNLYIHMDTLGLTEDLNFFDEDGNLKELNENGEDLREGMINLSTVDPSLFVSGAGVSGWKGYDTEVNQEFLATIYELNTNYINILTEEQKNNITGILHDYEFGEFETLFDSGEFQYTFLQDAFLEEFENRQSLVTKTETVSEKIALSHEERIKLIKEEKRKAYLKFCEEREIAKKLSYDTFTNSNAEGFKVMSMDEINELLKNDVTLKKRVVQNWDVEKPHSPYGPMQLLLNTDYDLLWRDVYRIGKIDLGTERDKYKISDFEIRDHLTKLIEFSRYELNNEALSKENKTREEKVSKKIVPIAQDEQVTTKNAEPLVLTGFIKWAKMDKHKHLSNSEFEKLEAADKIELKIVNDNEIPIKGNAYIVTKNQKTNKYEYSEVFEINNSKKLTLAQLYQEENIPVEVVTFNNKLLTIADNSNINELIHRVDLSKNPQNIVNDIVDEIKNQTLEKKVRGIIDDVQLDDETKIQTDTKVEKKPIKLKY
jgi:hypothetical protein